MLESLVPRLKPGVRVQAREDGSSVLVEPRSGTYVEIASDQANLLALVDGTRSASEVAAEHYNRHRFVPFQALGDLLATLRARGLLENTEAELDQAGVPPPPPAARSRALASVLLVRVPVPGLSPVLKGLFALWAVGVVASLGLCLVRNPFWPAEVRVDPLRPDGGPLEGLLYALLGAYLALTARTVARSGLAAWLGAAPAALEARLHYFLPALEIDPGPVKLLSKPRRMWTSVAALVAPWQVALAALLQDGQPQVAVSAALGALVVGFIDACPFAPTSVGTLLAAVAGRVDLRDHARSYLSRKLLSRVGSKDFFDGEKVILVSASLSAVWAMIGVELLARNVPGMLVRLYASIPHLAGAEQVAAYVSLGVVTVGSLGGLYLMGQTLLAALGSVIPSSMRQKPVEAATSTSLAADGAGAEALLAKVPLFAALPREALADLAKEVKKLTYPQGAVVVRQGDAGDRFYAIVEGAVQVEHEAESGLRRTIARLGSGDCFGELALLNPVRRAATVKAVAPVTALALTHEGFARLVEALPGVDLTRLIRAAATLHKNPLFKAMPPDRISSLLPRLVPRSVEAGSLVVKKGDAGDYFYLVADGELEVLDEQNEKPVARLGNGDHFGEVALLRDIPRIASVRATRNTALFSLSKADFFNVLGRDLSLSRSLEDKASSRVKEVQ